MCQQTSTKMQSICYRLSDLLHRLKTVGQCKEKSAFGFLAIMLFIISLAFSESNKQFFTTIGDLFPLETTKSLNNLRYLDPIVLFFKNSSIGNISMRCVSKL